MENLDSNPEDYLDKDKLTKSPIIIIEDFIESLKEKVKIFEFLSSEGFFLSKDNISPGVRKENSIYDTFDRILIQINDTSLSNRFSGVIYFSHKNVWIFKCQFNFITSYAKFLEFYYSITERARLFFDSRLFLFMWADLIYDNYGFISTQISFRDSTFEYMRNSYYLVFIKEQLIAVTNNIKNDINTEDERILTLHKTLSDSFCKGFGLEYTWLQKDRPKIVLEILEKIFPKQISGDLYNEIKSLRLDRYYSEIKYITVKNFLKNKT